MCFGIGSGNKEPCATNKDASCVAPEDELLRTQVPFNVDGGFGTCDPTDPATFTTQYLDHSWIQGASDIDELPLADWSTGVFMRDYFGKKPALLTDASVLYYNASKRFAWVRDMLIERHGDRIVPYMVKPGSGRGQAAPINISSLLMDKMRGCADAARLSQITKGDISEAPYSFSGQDELLSNSLPWSIPQLLRDFGLSKGDSKVCSERGSVCYLAIGASASGILMHDHQTAHAFSEVVFGRKAWYLQKPNCKLSQAAAGIQTSAEWLLKPLRTKHAKQSDQSDCDAFHSLMQRPSDVLYIPPGYHHATFNVDETVGAVIHVDVEQAAKHLQR